jgi:RNA polymerase sigma-54 factor
MILKDIAALTGRDMSVISRATNGKYVATRGGLYPLKMFFNERPKEDSDVSSHQILEALKSMIDAEDKRHPLSDDALADMLNARGFDIARRTVAKYREQINIPNSRGRRDLAKPAKSVK